MRVRESDKTIQLHVGVVRVTEIQDGRHHHPPIPYPSHIASNHWAEPGTVSKAHSSNYSGAVGVLSHHSGGVFSATVGQGLILTPLTCIHLLEET